MFKSDRFDQMDSFWNDWFQLLPGRVDILDILVYVSGTVDVL